MTLPLSEGIKHWSAGYDARMEGMPRKAVGVPADYVYAWEEGWDEADEFFSSTTNDKGIESMESFRIYDGDGDIVQG